MQDEKFAQIGGALHEWLMDSMEHSLFAGTDSFPAETVIRMESHKYSNVIMRAACERLQQVLLKN